MNKRELLKLQDARLKFWKSMSMNEVEVFAKKCKTSGAYLRQIAYGHRKPSPEMCLRLERLSDGGWSKETLRPDVYL